MMATGRTKSVIGAIFVVWCFIQLVTGARSRAAGYVIYGIASLFLLVSIVAAVETRRTGRFQSGVHIVPTAFALIGTIAGRFSWLPLLVFALLDFGILFLAPRRNRVTNSP